MARLGRLVLDLAIDAEQLRPDLFPPLAKSGQELRMRRPIAPSAPHPVLLADELQGHSVQGAELRELFDVIGERGPPDEPGSRQRHSRSMQMSSTSRRCRSGPAGGGRPQVVRELGRSRGAARHARSGGRATRIPRQASSCRSASRSRIRASDRRTERPAAPRVRRDFGDLQALQPEFQHPSPEGVEP